MEVIGHQYEGVYLAFVTSAQTMEIVVENFPGRCDRQGKRLSVHRSRGDMVGKICGTDEAGPSHRSCIDAIVGPGLCNG